MYGFVVYLSTVIMIGPVVKCVLHIK